MSRKGRLNESHTEQDTRAGETANNKAQHTTHIPIPEEMWNIVDEGGGRVHSRIRKTAEEGVKRRIFMELLEESNDKGEKTQHALRDIMKAIQGKQKPVREVWGKIINGTNREKLGYLMRIRQNRLALNEKLAKIGIIENGDCRVCARRYPERTETGQNAEDIEHVWSKCGMGSDKREEIVKEVAIKGNTN